MFFAYKLSLLFNFVINYFCYLMQTSPNSLARIASFNLLMRGRWAIGPVQRSAVISLKLSNSSSDIVGTSQESASDKPKDSTLLYLALLVAIVCSVEFANIYALCSQNEKRMIKVESSYCMHTSFSVLHRAGRILEWWDPAAKRKLRNESWSK